MGNIILWDDGISNQTITIRDDDFPLNEVSPPIDSPQPLAIPGTPVLLGSGLRGLAFYRSASPNLKLSRVHRSLEQKRQGQK